MCLIKLIVEISKNVFCHILVLGQRYDRFIPVIGRPSSGPCPLANPPHFCDRSAIYRTIDGSCNNLNNANWGRSQLPLGRLISPDYDSGSIELISYQIYAFTVDPEDDKNFAG